MLRRLQEDEKALQGAYFFLWKALMIYEAHCNLSGCCSSSSTVCGLSCTKLVFICQQQFAVGHNAFLPY